MAYDSGMAQILREDLRDEPVTERRMFGGLAFLRHGHMVCGLHKGGTMFRVGKPNEAAAPAIEGAHTLMFTGRPMTGMVGLSDEAAADDRRRAALMTLALGYVKTLPPK